MDCEAMFLMQEANLLSFLHTGGVEEWEENEESFHYFYELVLHLSALLKLQIPLKIHILYLPHMQFLMKEIDKIEKHPRSKNILYLQFMHTYIGMKRLWHKSTMQDEEIIHR